MIERVVKGSPVKMTYRLHNGTVYYFRRSADKPFSDNN